jgi:hypothetical protein
VDLLRPWTAAVVAWIVMNILAVLAISAWSSGTQLQTFGTRIFWIAVPQLLVGAVAATAAAYLHRRPERADPRRHALASLGGPAVMIVLQAVLNLVGDTVLSSTLIAFVAEGCGAVLGWLFVSRVARREERAADTGSGYY